MTPVPLVPNGVYKIQAISLVADLRAGNPYGVIISIPEGDFDAWKIENRGDGGNQVYIENDRKPGSYANIRGEYPNSQLHGSTEPILWTLVKLDEGTYYIQTEDGQYVWQFQGPGEPIVLARHSGQDNQKVRFEKVWL